MSAERATSNSPKITQAMFRRMLQKMSPEQLRRLPPESLPDDIPLELIDEAPPELREILEDLSFSLSSRQLSDREDDRERYGEEAAAAIDRKSVV